MPFLSSTCCPSVLQYQHDRRVRVEDAANPALQLQVPLLPDDASQLFDQLLRSELPAAYASLRKPTADGGASAAVVIQTVAQLVTVAAVADTLTPAAASELAVVAWRSV